jgi:hypothetical protein
MVHRKHRKAARDAIGTIFATRRAGGVGRSRLPGKGVDPALFMLADGRTLAGAAPTGGVLPVGEAMALMRAPDRPHRAGSVASSASAPPAQVMIVTRLVSPIRPAPPLDRL